MTVNGATNDPTTASSLLGQTSSQTTGQSKLGQDAFLNLLVTQLKHQDPLQPKDDAEFLAQLAQFSSLEQLTSINDSIRELADLMKAAMGDTGSPASTGDPNSDRDTSTGTEGTGTTSGKG